MYRTGRALKYYEIPIIRVAEEPDSLHDTTLEQQKMWEAVQELSVPDDDLRAAFGRKGEDRAEYRKELLARAKGMRHVIRKAELAARRMDLIAGLM